VEALRLKQLLVIALFDNVAILHNKNQDCVPHHRGKPVGNHETGAVFYDVLHRLLNQNLRARVDGACRFNETWAAKAATWQRILAAWRASGCGLPVSGFFA